MSPPAQPTAEIGGEQSAPGAKDLVGADTSVPDRDADPGATSVDTEIERTKTPERPEQSQIQQPQQQPPT